MAFIHSVCYTILLIDEGDYAVSMAENYLVWGVVEYYMWALMCFQGLLFEKKMVRNVLVLQAYYWNILSRWPLLPCAGS